MTEAGFFAEVVRWFADPARWSGSGGIPTRLVEHLVTSGVSVAVATLLAFPAGLLIGHLRRGEFLVVSLGNLGRAVPSFGLILLLVVLFGAGLGWPPSLRPPALVAMVLLAIPPILTNTYVGIQTVDPDTIEAARGMGMTEVQVVRTIELPLAAPVIVAGLRTAAVQVVATATLAAVVAGGGLGRFILDCFAVRDFPCVFSGALLVALLAIAVEGAFALLARAVAPRTAGSRPRPGLRPGTAPSG